MTTRRKCLAVFFGLLLVAPLLAASPAKPGLMKNLAAGKPQRIVTYGTSLTAGGAWVDQLREQLSLRFPKLVEVVNSGQGAMWSKWGVDNLDERVIQKKPDAVFIEFSINDAYLDYHMSTQESKANLQNMIDRILTAAPDCQIILMVMNPPTGEHLERRPKILDYNQVYRDVAKARTLLLIDHYPIWEKILKSDPAKYKALVPDGIHPSAEGCKQVITPGILNALGLKPTMLTAH
jgi:acyl-CoA thioesterase-1